LIPFHRRADILSVAECRRLGTGAAFAADSRTTPMAVWPRAGRGRGEAVHATTIIGDFQLVREIGRGGMGVVHLARQLSLGRLVALKILPAEFTADPLRLERFHREAEVISRLDHPSIVPVYAVGHEDGIHYIAMKFLDGETLDNVIRARRPPDPGLAGGGPDPVLPSDTQVLPKPGFIPRTRRILRLPGTPAVPVPIVSLASESEAGWLSRCVRIVEKVARALHHAHTRGVIHRDVKPGNIFLDASGHPWLLDFGLVRDLSANELTRTDSFLGTAWYMAPEQVRRDPGGPDHRADVYALGVTLYEMLTLRRPFEYRSPDTLFHAIVNEEPIPPRRFNPQLPRDLETVALKAMSKNPAERYASAQAMADDLKRIRGYEPIEARPQNILGRGRRWIQRNPALSAALLFGVLSFTGMVEVLVWRQRLDERRAQTALEAADRAYDLGDVRAALTHYDTYIMLGGDEEIVAPRRNSLKKLLEPREGDPGPSVREK
jgi:hypothetical protein